MAILRARTLQPHLHARQHYEQVVVQLCERLQELESRPWFHVSFDEPLQQPPIETEMHRVNQQVENVADLVGIVASHVEMQGQKIDKIEQNVADAAAYVPAAEQQIVKRYYPPGYRERCCSKSLVLKMMIVWVSLGVVWVLVFL